MYFQMKTIMHHSTENKFIVGNNNLKKNLKKIEKKLKIKN